MDSCCVPDCPRTSDRFYRFPRPNGRSVWKRVAFKIWVHRINSEQFRGLSAVDVYSQYKICDAHFTDYCRVPPCIQLKVGSLPTLFLPNFRGAPNEVNSQLALLQNYPDAEEMKSFGAVIPPGDYTRSLLEPDKDLWVINLEENGKTVPSINPEDLNHTPELQKPYFQVVKFFITESNSLSDVCRVCFNPIEGEDVVKLCEGGEQDEAQVKDKLEEVLPDLDLDVYQNSVICKKCNDLIVCSYELRKAWLATEEKLRIIVENERRNPTRNACLILIPAKTEAAENETFSEHNYAQNEQSATKQNSTKRYECEFCEESFGFKQLLEKHLIYEHSEEAEPSDLEEMKCKVCSDAFGSVVELKQHNQQVHGQAEKKLKIFECDVCKKTFVLKQLLLHHMRSAHMKYFAQCHICGKIINKRIFKQHLSGHAGQGTRTWDRHKQATMFKCEYCGRSIKHEHALDMHVKIYHKNEGRFNCEFCDKPYWKRTDVENHQVRVHGWSRDGDDAEAKAHSCGTCEKAFARAEWLQQHVDHVHLKVPFYVQCHLCGKLTARSRLGEHLRWHSGEKPHACAVCDKKFATKGLLEKHKMSHADTRFECPFCGKLIKHEKALETHIKIYHTNEGKHNCEFCGRPYWKRCDLLKHKVKVHDWAPELPHEREMLKFEEFECEICKKTFTTKQSVQIHFKYVHLKMPNRVQCHLCGKSLHTNRLREHLMVHSGERPFVCDVCDKRFISNAAMKRHQLRHLDTEYQCPYCRRKTKQELGLKRHIKKYHTKEGKFMCEFCDESFWEETGLIDHLVKEHDFYFEEEEAPVSNENTLK